MTQNWNTTEPAPMTGDNFIYISVPDKTGNRLVSKACWREGDENYNEGYYDLDIGEEPDIAGWIDMPAFAKLTE